MKQQQQLLSPFHSIHRSREKRAPLKKEIFFFSCNQKQFGRFTTSPPSSLGEWKRAPHRERIQRQLQMQQKRERKEELLFRVGPGVTGAHHVPDVSGAQTIATTPKEIKLLGKQKTHTTQTGIIIPLFRSSSKTISLSSQKDQTWEKTKKSYTVTKYQKMGERKPVCTTSRRILLPK